MISSPDPNNVARVLRPVNAPPPLQTLNDRGRHDFRNILILTLIQNDEHQFASLRSERYRIGWQNTASAESNKLLFQRLFLIRVFSKFTRVDYSKVATSNMEFNSAVESIQVDITIKLTCCGRASERFSIVSRCL